MNNEAVKTPFSNGTHSLGMPSSEISTLHYNGPDVQESIMLEPITSSRSVLPTIPPSIGFKYKPRHKYAKESDRALDFEYNPIVVGDRVFYRSGSSNVMEFSLNDIKQYGPAYLPEDPEFKHWKMAGEADMTVKYTNPEKFRFLVEGPETISSSHPDKFLKSVNYIGPNGQFGRYLSIKENRMQDLRDIFDSTQRDRFETDTLDFANFLIQTYGITEREITAIGIEDLGTRYSAGLYSKEGKSTLVYHTDFNQIAKAMMEKYDLSGSEALKLVKLSVLYHELVHHFQPNMSRRNKEIDVGERLSDYYSPKGSLIGGEKGRTYKILDEEEEAYAEGWRSKGILRSNYKSMRSKIRASKEKTNESELNEEGNDCLENELEGYGESMEGNDLERYIEEGAMKYEENEGIFYNDDEFVSKDMAECGEECLEGEFAGTDLESAD